MNRFTPSNDTLTIEVDDGSVDLYAIAAAWALVNAGSRQVYFRGESGRPYPHILAAAHAGIVWVWEGEEPADFDSSARILHSARELVVFSPKPLRKDQWRAIATQIEADVAAARA